MLYILVPTPGYLIAYWILDTGYWIIYGEIRFIVVEVYQRWPYILKYRTLYSISWPVHQPIFYLYWRIFVTDLLLIVCMTV